MTNVFQLFSQYSLSSAIDKIFDLCNSLVSIQGNSKSSLLLWGLDAGQLILRS